MMMVVGCTQIGAMAPNYAIGTYKGAVIARGYCSSPAADMTISIGTSSASGGRYFEQPKVQAQFGDGWVNPGGFFSSRYAAGGGMDYVSGHFVDSGAAIDTTIDMRGCIYVGTLARV